MDLVANCLMVVSACGFVLVIEVLQVVVKVFFDTGLRWKSWIKTRSFGSTRNPLLVLLLAL